MAEVQYQEPKRTSEGENFIIELVVQGKPIRVPSKCYNRESASHTALAVVAMNYPNVQGYNILSPDGETLLEEVHPTPLLMHAAPIIQAITGQQLLKAGVPIVKTVNPEQFQKMVDDAKQKGRLIQ